MNTHEEGVLLPRACAENIATATPSTSLAPLMLDLTNLPQADAQLTALLPHLAQLDDGQLIHLATDARRLETCAFRLRGACVAELRRRIKIRLTGGRGNRDTSGVGAGAQLARLAARIGVSVSTLKLDARIHKVFFGNEHGEVVKETERQAATETRFAREFYVTALTSPNPNAAIRYAAKKCAAATDYSREDFRRDVLALKQTMQPTLTTSVESAPVEAAPKSAPNLRVKIIPEAQAVLDELTNRSGQSPETIVAEALLMYHQAQIAPATTIVAPSPKRKRRANSASEQQMQPSLISPSRFGSH